MREETFVLKVKERRTTTRFSSMEVLNRTTILYMRGEAMMSERIIPDIKQKNSVLENTYELRNKKCLKEMNENIGMGQTDNETER